MWIYDKELEEIKTREYEEGYQAGLDTIREHLMSSLMPFSLSPFGMGGMGMGMGIGFRAVSISREMMDQLLSQLDEMNDGLPEEKKVSTEELEKLFNVKSKDDDEPKK